MKATFGVALIFVLTIPKFAIAQDDEQAEIDQAEVESSEIEDNSRPIEQIDIVGERSLMSMRYQIRVAEENLYDLFNDLNKVEKYNIRCRTEQRTSSHIRTRSCEPKFFIDLRQDVNRDAMAEIRFAFGIEGMDIFALRRGIERLEPDSEIREILSQDYEGMEQEMFRIATENEDYLNQLIRLGELKAEYDEAWQLRFGKEEN